MSYPQPSPQNLPQTLNVQELNNPLLVFEAFFKEYHIAEATRLLQKWLRSAFAEKSRFGKSDVMEIFYFHEQLACLVEAAALLNDNPENKNKSLHPHDHSDDTLSNISVPARHCFIGFLDDIEYTSPYIVFAKCFGHLDLGGWRCFLKNLFKAAASDGFINEYTQDDDLYTTLDYLCKLLHACHLIKEREIDAGLSPESATKK